MKTAIIVPARYGSTRFPGKPLEKIAGREMLLRIYDNVLEASAEIDGVQVAVATEDSRIMNFCSKYEITCFMTSEECPSGTDRVKEAAEQLDDRPDFIVNVQGDLIIPPHFIRALINDYRENQDVDILTSVTHLTWDALDDIREAKKVTPFSGTTVTFDKNRYAFWFSKQIIPAIRGEDKLRSQGDFSPVYRQQGLYAYSFEALQKYTTLEPSNFEKLEGLEQLRALENGMKIRCVPVSYDGYPAFPGIDSPEDVARAEKLLAEM